MIDKPQSDVAPPSGQDCPSLGVDTLAPGVALGAASSELTSSPTLPFFFDARAIVPLKPDSAAAVGWGLKRSGLAAAAFAARTGRPHALLEDGFIRSVGLGKTGSVSVSLVVDDLGAYYDPAAPSRLERLLQTRAADAAGVRASAREALARWRDERLSKYNLGEDTPCPAARGRIVLVDQTAGDRSLAGVGPDVLAAMLRRAEAQGMRDHLVLRVHPDVAAGKTSGVLASAARDAGVPFLTDDASPAVLIEEAREIWTISSGLGFEALLRGCRVVTFGTPFYAGWGLSQDAGETPLARACFARRKAPVDLEELFGATFLLYTRYIDPVRRKRCDFHEAVDRLLDWRGRARRLPRHDVVAFSVPRSQRRNVGALIGADRRGVEFAGPADWRGAARLLRAPVPTVAVWGAGDTPVFRRVAARRGVQIERLDEGPMRAIGLGSSRRDIDSVVIDGPHSYRDGSGPTHLEEILLKTDFTPDLVERAAQLVGQMARRYSARHDLHDDAAGIRSRAAGRPVALVVGQAPGDPALRPVAGGIRSNEDLLRAVRAERPDAFLVYAGHPDFAEGRRPGRIDRKPLDETADLAVDDDDLRWLHGAIDELHVVSAPAGFEGLLRGIPVVAWGVPYYAGWGLTRDKLSCPRRNRVLTLHELVAGALILHPLYMDPLSHIPCSAEDYLAIPESA